jgi:hypothetical protein
MGGFSNNSSTGGGGGGVGPAGKKSDGSYGSKKDAKKTSNRNEFSSAAKKAAKFVATGGVTGAILRSLTSNSKKKNKDGYGGEAYGYNEADEKIDYKENPFTNGSGNDNQPKGIELAKASTGSATILGPGEIQKEAANNVKGPTTTEMSADEISLANKRKGRKQTNITAKATLAKNYKLSEKTLLG